MGAAIGGSVPYAIAAAASPVPVTAVILMLLAQRRGVTALTFCLGRLLGYALLLALVTLGSELIGRGLHSDLAFASVVARLGVGVLMLAAGIWTWPRRRGPTTANGLWRRVRALDGITPLRSGGAGLVLSMGPKSLILLVGGGLAIAEAVATPAGGVVAAVVFLAIATSTVLVPLLLFYAAGQRAVAVLQPVEAWIGAHAVTISAAALAVIGTVLIVTSVADLL